MVKTPSQKRKTQNKVKFILCFLFGYPLAFLCCHFGVPFGANFSCLVVFVVLRFVVGCSRFSAWLRSRVCSSSYILPWLVLSVAFLPFRFVAWVVSLVRFVRFPRPARFWWLGGSACRWFCVPLSSLSSVRASCFVFAVRPAVVCRRSGVVLFVWVWGCRPTSHTSN